ncbi:hypothetical protein Tco_0600072 [Tanacetum coccineum]|uniref:Uncharacterized protein n=1 Tax=Tanacetum coccineum TaxID=301880 RepID=A0ABQ4WAQ7_9ASTR
MMRISEGSTSGFISDSVLEELRRITSGNSAYKAKKQKELGIMEFKELEFLTSDTGNILVFYLSYVLLVPILMDLT